MTDRSQQPAYALHAVVSLLDSAADRILPTLNLTYAKYLMLLTVERLEGATQRELAAALGVTEPSVSRSLRALQADGLVATDVALGTGNRRSARLTTSGQAVVETAAAQLEQAFAALLADAGLSGADVLAVTGPLLALLSEKEQA